jgi:hypothetical protein
MQHLQIVNFARVIGEWKAHAWTLNPNPIGAALRSDILCGSPYVLSAFSYLKFDSDFQRCSYNLVRPAVPCRLTCHGWCIYIYYYLELEESLNGIFLVTVVVNSFFPCQ